MGAVACMRTWLLLVRSCDPSGAFGITEESAKFLFRVDSVVSPTAYRREASFWLLI